MHLRAFTIGLCLFSATTLTAARPANSRGFVYTMTNDPAGNEIVQFTRTGGTLTPLSRTATGGLGGTGNGVGALDPLGSQDSLILSGTGSMLLAVNAGSDQLSALSVSSDGVRLLNSVGSGGSFPNSVALRDDLVYVLNAHGTPNVSGFRVGPAGLTPIPGSTFPLPGAGSAIPHDVRFSPDGSRLLVSDEGTGSIDVFQLDAQGLITSVTTTASPGAGPFGMKFARGGVLLNTEAGSASVSSYALASSNTLTVITAALTDRQTATCWISLAADGKFGFVSNTGSGNFSSYLVAGDGTLSLAQRVAGTADGGAPIDSALSSDGAFLFSDDSKLGRVLEYAVRGSGLMQVGAVSGLPTTLQGIAAQ